MKYVIYPDVFWVTNFVMDVLVLSLIRKFKKSRSPLLRILVAAAFGAFGTVIFFLHLHNYMLYQLAVHVLLNPFMIFISFPVKSLHGFFKDFFGTYLMMMMIGGILSFGMTTLGQWKQFWLWAAGSFGVCMLTLFWQELRREEALCFEILLMTAERKIALTGFLDTGNRLEDPILRQPVHIIQEDVLSEALTEERLPIRYIPFHSLGQEQGLLPVVTLKAMYIRCMGEKEEVPPLYIEKPVFGLAKEKLFSENKYQVILNARGIPT